ncbi:hypothetical protein BGW80DRAFT_1463312 [Lactifluus volemus]|nr:hypothetical protein BGW80DRAFT_1463312 [Lactifluus volemus]
MSSPPLSPSPLSPSLKLGNLGTALRVAGRKTLAEAAIARSSNPPTSSVAPPQPSGSQDEAGTNSQDFSPPVFTGTPVSQPSSTPELIPPPADTAGGVGGPPQDPVYYPPREKLTPRRALTANDELSVFDIHNIFRRRWFLSRDHLMANVISAQKAEDGKISWVEFTPPYHAHLVKCAVALIPRPLQKVKKVMFAYILETLNGEAPKAFFDLTKGPSLASKAQKEKKHLARKRNRASRRQRRAAEEAAAGKSQRACKECGRKFASRKAQKRHRCPISKGASGKGGEAKGKGKAKPPATSNKPKAPPKAPTAPPTYKVDPPPTPPLEAAKQRLPKVAIAAAGPATFFEQPNVEAPPARHSNRLNTAAKRGMRRKVMESVIDKP